MDVDAGSFEIRHEGALPREHVRHLDIESLAVDSPGRFHEQPLDTAATQPFAQPENSRSSRAATR
jgi:hypothetical protein